MTTAAFLKTREWIQGPKCLYSERSSWSEPTEDCELKEGDVEVKSCHTVKDEKKKSFVILLSERCSSWRKLMRVVSWIQKAAVKFKRSDLDNPLVTVEDCGKAENFILKEVQHHYMGEELDLLTKSQCVKKKSKLYRLDPFTQNGLIHVGGRLRRSGLPYCSKHPIVVPKRSTVAKLLIRHCHREVGHMGRECVLAKLRENFWIVEGSTLIREKLKECLGCRKRWSRPMKQKMSDLPADRVSGDDPPFTNIGVDYFRPFFVKRGRGREKRWGCIFTCLTVRAVYIELAYSLSTDSFINALRRFVARRGQVRMIRSDNGTYFRGAQRELKAEMDKMNHAEVHNHFCGKRVKWVFKKPGVSYHGRSWGRMIRTIRIVFGFLLKEQVMSDEQLRTLMCETEAIINSRPLTVSSSNANDFAPLTPNDLLTMKNVPIFPPGIFDPNKTFVTRRWKQIQYMAEIF